MDTEFIFPLVIYMFVATFMIVMGIIQLKSHTPVAFYSGEEPPDASEISDVHAWNVSHGRMWIIYGIVIELGYFAGMCIGDSIYMVIPMVGVLLVPIPLMILNHNKLIKKYQSHSG